MSYGLVVRKGKIKTGFKAWRLPRRKPAVIRRPFRFKPVYLPVRTSIARRPRPTRRGGWLRAAMRLIRRRPGIWRSRMARALTVHRRAWRHTVRCRTVCRRVCA